MKTQFKTLVRKLDGQWMMVILEPFPLKPTIVENMSPIKCEYSLDYLQTLKDWSLYDLIEVAVIHLSKGKSKDDIDPIIFLKKKFKVRANGDLYKDLGVPVMTWGDICEIMEAYRQQPIPIKSKEEILEECLPHEPIADGKEVFDAATVYKAMEAYRQQPTDAGVGEIIKFGVWYSGMKEIQVRAAYERYLRETNLTKG